jgi:predicted DNA-binding WGR domain protein
MSEERTYLELSEEGGGAHKFYEAVVRGSELIIRYGRIGDAGQTSTKTFPTPEAARAEARKKVAEKTKKGYAPAVLGQRQKRAVTQRVVNSTPSTATRAPVLWKFETGRNAFGIFIGGDDCWVGNQDGKVFRLDHSGKVRMQYQLPEGVKCLVGDEAWVYAGCDDGKVYDLTGKVPRLSYTIAEDVDILWLDVWAGYLAVSDNRGGVTLFDPEEELLWARESLGTSGWMVRCDSTAIYHGHTGGVTAYRLANGEQLWHQGAEPIVLFGWQGTDRVYAGTGTKHVYALDKRDGRVLATCDSDWTVLSNAASPDGRFLFAADSSSSVYCFDAKGRRLWKLGTDCGSALSMQYHDGKLYLATSNGTLACLDASPSAVQKAQAGTLPKVREIKAPEKAVPVAETTAVETTTDAGAGVVVECVSDGGKVRVRVASPGYHKDWNVQFPRNLREAGVRYVVDSVRESAQGGYYRAHGDIRKVGGGPVPPPGPAPRRRSK